MKFGSMLGDIIRSLFKQPVTQLYPAQRTPTPERLRGSLHYDPGKCTGCCLCAKDCPADAIEVITIDKANKRFLMRYHMDRCTYCAQCVQSCRQGCIKLSKEEWELAGVSKEPFTVYYGSDADIEHFLAGIAKAGAESA